MTGRFARLVKAVLTTLPGFAARGAGQPGESKHLAAAPPATDRERRPADRKPRKPPARPVRPRDAPGPEMILVPAGPYYAGLTDAQARQFASRPDWSDVGAEVNRPAFQIAKYPVTSGEFLSFLANTGRPPPMRWDGSVPPEPLRDRPMVWVSLAAATAYCDWLRAETGIAYRLPTAAEREKAARGTDGRMFPPGVMSSRRG